MVNGNKFTTTCACGCESDFAAEMLPDGKVQIVLGGVEAWAHACELANRMVQKDADTIKVYITATRGAPWVILTAEDAAAFREFLQQAMVLA